MFLGARLTNERTQQQINTVGIAFITIAALFIGIALIEHVCEPELLFLRLFLNWQGDIWFDFCDLWLWFVWVVLNDWLGLHNF